MFKKILFATSATRACEPAARVAFNISSLYKAKLTVFHVTEPDQDTAAVKKKIETHCAEHLSKPCDFEIKTVAGNSSEEILKQVETQNPDLLVMGVSTRGEAGLEDAIKNAESSFQRIVKSVNCPVLIVNRPAASFWGTISNIVFATDFSKASDAAFDFASAFVKETHSEFHIFHAQNVSLTPGSKEFDQNAIEARRREKLNFSQKKYASMMEDIENYSVEVWEGSPYIEIVKYARDKYADLIITAKDSQNPGSKTDALGSTVRQVVLRAGCPVLCVHK